MGDSQKYQKLPPGWDCKYDQATGNCYYVNYFTKAMQLEDPRMRYRQLQNERCSTESIPLQALLGSSTGGSPYHVYPSNNLPAMRAFHSPTPGILPSLQNISASPLLSSRGHLEMSPQPFPKSTPLMQTPRLMANMSRRSTIQETSFSSHMDTDAMVAKIQNMFPTASENHIRLLLKKYYNREAVVISALQVEKHPVTMPGPIATPPAQRHLLFHSNSAFHMTPPARRLDIGAALSRSVSRTASPVPGGRFGSVMSVQAASGGGSGVGAAGRGFPDSLVYYLATGGSATAIPLHGSPRFGEHHQWRHSPRPHSSPKMKLRYMKNIFPKADEMLLLDILADSDNNVQTASEKLIALGYVKRDCLQPPKVSNRWDATAAGGGGDLASTAKQPDAGKIIPLHPKEYTDEEKTAMQQRLKEKYAGIAERIIAMALESVNYAEERAIQILQIVQQEEDEAKQLVADKATSGCGADAPSGSAADCHADRNAVAADGAADKCVERNSNEPRTGDNVHSREGFKSLLDRIASTGHNSRLAKGPDEHLLLADYVTWNGANPDITVGHHQQQLAVGPDAFILNERTPIARGRNPELCKGAQKGLAKGSIYAQIAVGGSKGANVLKCN